MWSEFDLENPSDDVVQYLTQENFRAENLQTLISELTETADEFTSEDLLWKETDSLKDLQVKYQSTFGCSRFLAVLHRVFHCLKKMVFLNLSKLALDLAERFLKGFKEDSIEPSLPSRQQLEFLLLRIQAAAKLVCEAIGYSQDVFCYVTDLKNSSDVTATNFITSVIAKICLLLKCTLDKVCDSYQRIIAYRYKLKLGNHKWAERLSIPLNLRIWIYGSDISLSKFLSSERSSPVLDAESVIGIDANTSASNNLSGATNRKRGGSLNAQSNAQHLYVPESEKQTDELVEISSEASGCKNLPPYDNSINATPNNASNKRVGNLNVHSNAQHLQVFDYEKEADELMEITSENSEDDNLPSTDEKHIQNVDLDVHLVNLSKRLNECSSTYSNGQHFQVSESEQRANELVEITSEASENEDLVPCDESPIPNVDLDVSLLNPKKSLTKKQKVVLKKILNAKSYKNLEAVWKKVKSLYRNDLLITLSARKEIIISKFLKRAKQIHQVFKSLQNLKGNALLGIRKSHSIKFALYLGYTYNHIDSFTKRSNGLINYRVEKRIRTFKTLKLLYSQLLLKLKADKKAEQCKELKAEFKRRTNDVKVLVKNGEKQCARRMITCISKVLLSLYNT